MVATNVGGIPDIVNHNETGLLVPSGDAKAAADAMVKLLSDTKLREKFAKAGEMHAEKYDWAMIAKQYAAVYEDFFR